jgi:hypothetical protein
VDDPGPHCLVVAFSQVFEQVDADGLSAGPGVLGGLVRVAEHGDDVGGQGLQAAGAEPGDGAAAADDDVLAALRDPGDLPVSS